MKYLLLLLSFCLAFNFSAAQDPIKGLVRDAETEEPLPFANIVLVGKHKGTVSNSEGYFILQGKDIAPNDSLLFSFIGYENLKVRASELQNQSIIYLHPAAVHLAELQVLSRSLTAEEILALVREHYPKNHPRPSQKQRIFFHKYEKTPFPEENKIILKESDFVGMDKETFQELFQKLPPEIIDYQDVLADLYSEKGGHKLVPVEAISLEEGSHQALVKEVESKLGAFFTDIEQAKGNADIYYKFRTGIISKKAGHKKEVETNPLTEEKDSLSLFVGTEHVKSGILFLLQEYGHIDSKNWEFIHTSRKYAYSIERMTLYNNEPVYEISFSPGKRGLFKGTMVVSANTYAILQLDFAYAEGKQSEKFQLLGIGHSMNFKKGRVIFEKAEAGYFIKYVHALQQESASIARNFTIMKKQKRFLWDKTLNEIKLEAQLFFDTETHCELLVINREETALQEFEKIKQPPTIKFRKEYAYAPEMWKNRTVIAPVSDLQKFKRK